MRITDIDVMEEDVQALPLHLSLLCALGGLCMVNSCRLTQFSLLLVWKVLQTKQEQISSKILQQKGEYVQLLFSQPIMDDHLVMSLSSLDAQY